MASATVTALCATLCMQLMRGLRLLSLNDYGCDCGCGATQAFLMDLWCKAHRRSLMVRLAFLKMARALLEGSEQCQHAESSPGA